MTAIIINPFRINVDVNYSGIACAPRVLLSMASVLIWATQLPLPRQSTGPSFRNCPVHDLAAFSYFLPSRMRKSPSHKDLI